MDTFFEGPDVVNDVDEYDERNPAGHKFHPLFAHFSRIAEETQEREEKVAKENQHTDPLPLVGLTGAVVDFAQVIPEGLFRNVGVPNQEVL